MVRGKKGAELSMNVVIIAIIAVLVLVVTAIVFTGGVSNAVQRMREFFNIGTEGQSLEFVREQCRLACDNAKLSSDPEDSQFCTRRFTVREAGEDVRYSCTNAPGEPDVKSAGVSCSVSCV